MSRRQAAAIAIVAVATAAAIAIGWLTRPDAPASAVEADHASATRPSPIVRATLVSRELTSGTLGFLGDRAVAHLGPAGVVTWAPAPGTVVEMGQILYRVNDRPVLLFYGDTPAWRDLRAEITDGPDIAQLEANLVALGHAGGLIAQPDARFDDATAEAVRRWQHAVGLDQTGAVTLGQAVFLPWPLRVTEVRSPAGSLVDVGVPVIAGTSTTRVVRVALDAARQTDVQVGDAVIVTLPGERATPGRVSDVSRVATSQPTDAAESDEAATVQVVIILDDPGAAGTLDQAPVEVAISTEERPDVLAVPVTALLAQPGGGYTVTTVSGEGTRQRIPVAVGIFDEVAGLIEIGGTGLREGALVEVPAQ